MCDQVPKIYLCHLSLPEHLFEGGELGTVFVGQLMASSCTSSTYCKWTFFVDDMFYYRGRDLKHDHHLLERMGILSMALADYTGVNGDTFNIVPKTYYSPDQTHVIHQDLKASEHHLRGILFRPIARGGVDAFVNGQCLLLENTEPSFTVPQHYRQQHRHQHPQKQQQQQRRNVKQRQRTFEKSLVETGGGEPMKCDRIFATEKDPSHPDSYLLFESRASKEPIARAGIQTLDQSVFMRKMFAGQSKSSCGGSDCNKILLRFSYDVRLMKWVPQVPENEKKG